MAKEKGLKYHKFLKNFLLFFIAAYNSILAALYFSGIMYGWADDSTVDAELVYNTLGEGAKTLDTVYACLLGIGTVVALVARFRLAKGFKDGVHTACGLIVYLGVIPFVYSIWGHVLNSAASIINLRDVVYLLFYVAVAVLTLKYYKKREELFKG